ncbi:hypothetical protein [Cytobacillus firmus]|uniref:hypothetical protein n=1 Tax=Cytobacillus firmus TaxID=1399 RepID=UPI0018CEBC26|nr:hypothetical protein [Cytobacillus firmus]MBG9590181.1 hypothetical protein [Cytobacillus firmus]
MYKPTYDLFQPSLKDGRNKTKSFDINRFFLVAFFGGTIPMMVLATRNAKWLNVPKQQTCLLLAASVLVLLTQVVIIYMYADGVFSEGNWIPRYSMQFLSILLFLLYKYVLNKPFQQHLLTNGELKPLFKPALLWIVIGGIIQLAIIVTAFTLTARVG